MLAPPDYYNVWIIKLPSLIKFSHDQAELASYSCHHRDVLGHCGASFFHCPLQTEVQVPASSFDSLFLWRQIKLKACALWKLLYVGKKKTERNPERKGPELVPLWVLENRRLNSTHLLVTLFVSVRACVCVKALIVGLQGKQRHTKKVNVLQDSHTLLPEKCPIRKTLKDVEAIKREE